MQDITHTWRDYAHLLTPEQIRFLSEWTHPDRWDEWSLSRLYGPDDIEAAHRGRLVTLARDHYGLLGPGRLN